MSGIDQQVGTSGGTSNGGGHGSGGAQQAAGGLQGAGTRGVLRETNKQPQYTEDGGFDLYKAQLRSFLTQRDCWGVISGHIRPDPNDVAQSKSTRRKYVRL